MESIVETKNVSKDFGSNKGIFDLSMSIHAGEIVGFVGPNGAGKSTTISLLAGNIAPTTGTVSLFGSTITPQSVHVHMPQIGFMLSEPTIETTLTARRIFLEAEQLLQQKTDWHRLSRVLNLDTAIPASQLSLGNKKKIEIILALMHQPRLVIMDEPTSGIDPLVMATFSTLLREVVERGGAVLLSSHNLNEVQEVCDRVIMIKEGRLLLDEPIAQLLKKSTRKISVNNPSKEVARLLHETFQLAPQQQATLTFQTKDYEKAIALLVKHKTYDFLIQNPSLEEMFAEYYR